MRENVGGVDRALRIAVGPAVAVAGYTWLGGSRGRLAGLAAIVAGALVNETVITKTCPLNALLGIDTAHRAPANPHVNRTLARSYYGERPAGLEAV